LDDNLGSGKQAIRIFREWLNLERKHLYVEALNSDEIDWLTKAKLIYLPIIGFEDKGMQDLPAFLGSKGLRLEISPVLKLREDQGCFHPVSGILAESDREEARKMASEIGHQLFAKKNWTEEAKKGRALGYGNSQKLIVFWYNTPTCTLPILWAHGEYEGRPWMPLFPRRE
jgi:hypothetical protein